MLQSPSTLAWLLTLLLGFCSASIFVWLYTRAARLVAAAGGQANNSDVHKRTNANASSSSSSSSNNHTHHQPSSQLKHIGAHVYGSSATSAIATHDSLSSHSPHSHTLSPLAPSSLTSASSSLTAAATRSPSSSLHHTVSATTPTLTAADIALRGRKAKKRDGRVHVMLQNSTTRHRSASNATTAGTTAAAATLASPYVYPLDFLSAAPPVIVCLTTLPSRVHHIDKCLSSIKTQNYPIAQMLLAIPNDSRRESGCKYSIPDRVRRDAIMSVIRVPIDYGPNTRVITALQALPQQQQHADTIIITLDDDCIYHPDTVATLVRHALQYPDAALAFAGYSVRGRPYIQPNLQYCKRRDERADLQWQQTQLQLQSQIQHAALAAAANNGSAGMKAAAAAALATAAAANPNHPLHQSLPPPTYATAATFSSAPLSLPIDPALLPPFEPISDVELDADPYSYPLPNPNDVYETECVDVLCGWRGGVCCRKRFLDERLWKDMEGMPEAVYSADDEWISAQLAANGIERRVILAPFDMILGRLRLRHGRHSSSASQLAHQQTMLEVLVDEKKMFSSKPNRTSQPLSSAASPLRSTAATSSEKEPTADKPATTAADMPPLSRLQQLIRPLSNAAGATA